LPLDSTSKIIKVSQGDKIFAYYQDQLNFIWSKFGHEKDVPEYSWESEK
jgi:hypothetical protein